MCKSLLTLALIIALPISNGASAQTTAISPYPSGALNVIKAGVLWVGFAAVQVTEDTIDATGRLVDTVNGHGRWDVETLVPEGTETRVTLRSHGGTGRFDFKMTNSEVYQRNVRVGETLVLSRQEATEWALMRGAGLQFVAVVSKEDAARAHLAERQ